MPGFVIEFVSWFVRLAGKEARDEFKRRKTREKAREKAEKAAVAKAKLDTDRATEKAAYLAKIAMLDEATLKLKRAQHAAEMDVIANTNRPVDNPWGEP